MATKKVMVEREQITCDVDGCDAEGRHMKLVINGNELDLCEKHIALMPIAKGAKTTRVTKVKSDTSAIRAWAAANNIEVPKRGRIPQKVMDQYQAETDGI